MTYCTATQLLVFADERVVADYISDSGTPATHTELVDDPVTDPNEFNVRLLAILNAASQKIIMACRRGQKYSLAALTELYNDESRPSSERADRQYQIIPLCANLAVGILVGRRVLAVEEVFKIAPFYKEALDILDELRSGFLVFDDFEQRHAEAGVKFENVVPSPLTPNWSACASRLLGSPGCGCGPAYPNVGGYSVGRGC